MRSCIALPIVNRDNCLVRCSVFHHGNVHCWRLHLLGSHRCYCFPCSEDGGIVEECYGAVYEFLRSLEGPRKVMCCLQDRFPLEDVCLGGNGAGGAGYHLATAGVGDSSDSSTHPCCCSVMCSGGSGV